jgi:hypothetical protein
VHQQIWTIIDKGWCAGIVQGIGGGGIFVCATLGEVDDIREKDFVAYYWCPSPVVPQWFKKKRALAMGVASSGLGAGSVPAISVAHQLN